MQLKIELNEEEMERLAIEAMKQKRSIVRQAEVILRIGLGLPFPRVIPEIEIISPNPSETK